MRAEPTTPGSTGSPWAIVAAVFAGCWTVTVTVLAQTGGWAVDQVVLIGGLDRLVPLWPVVCLLTVLLVAAAALPLALIPRSAAVRVTGRVWFAGALALGLLGLLRTIPPVHHEAYLAALAFVAVLLAVVTARLPSHVLGPGRRADEARLADPVPGRHDHPVGGAGEHVGLPDQPDRLPSGGPGHGTGPEAMAVGRPARLDVRPSVAALLAIAAGLALLLPWVWWGALGGLLETVLAGLAAAAVGALAATLLDARFWGRFDADEPPRPARLVLLGGLVAGVVLLLVGAGTGHSGAQLPLLVTLPPAGFALAALRAMSRRPAAGRGVAHPGTWPGVPDQPATGDVVARHPARAGGRAPAAWLVGLGVFGPLAFTDPEEVSLLLVGTRDVPFWVAAATGAGLAVGLVLAVGYGLLLARRSARTPSRALAAASALTLLVTVGLVGSVAGQPGLHGERLFVLLREQADLSGVSGGPGRAGRDARAGEVYRRLVDTADRTQADLRRDLRRARLPHTPYYLVNAIEVAGGPAVRAWLSSRPEVARVLVSQRLRPLPAPADSATGSAPAPSGPPWHITMIGADRVWSELGVTGAGVTVGSSDSGVDGRHPALAQGFRGGDDSWFDPWNGTGAPTDRGGHGTHTMGSAVGRDGIGVAPGAQWVGCVNLDRNLGNPAAYLDCLQFMLAPFPPGGDPFRQGRPARAPEILTNSWGCPPIEGCDPRALQPATAALEAAGILVVAAAGNTGPFCGSVQDPPAPYPDVLTVGAVDDRRRVTAFSSRGPTATGTTKPDLMAPGAEVISAMPGGGYAVLDGTSMATPQVAGVAALMWSANPELVGDLDRTRRILRETAEPIETSDSPRNRSDECGGPANLVGAGLVDAYAAVSAARG
ncbi:S8 family serine peptidase [Verrucosispora sp. WMMA2044]|uniref:S8 family serine peptidase n=1 Tax=Verrucosispora sp. WMMA2044 TaxID=3016419 RepID=UPI00248D18B5|nr:S8 family serine peptidase [Verrucosispora sp. WMMA2044]WBB48853.1 S8 family serine peptidase [Verrucosispora sp. WMMA2044]